jgi:hypothetical protein
MGWEWKKKKVGLGIVGRNFLLYHAQAKATIEIQPGKQKTIIRVLRVHYPHKSIDK